MKQILLVLTGCLVSTLSFAQITAGTKFIGGQVGGQIKSDEVNGMDSKLRSLHVNPTVGYFMNSNWMLGLQGIVSSSNVNYEHISYGYGSGYTSYAASTTEQRSFTIGLAPVARYYIPVHDRFAFFAEARAGVARTKTTIEVENSSDYYTGTSPYPIVIGSPIGYPSTPNSYTSYNSNKMEQDSFYSGIAPGIVFFATPKLGIELKVNALNFNSYKNSNSRSSGNELNTDFSLAKASFGAGFYF